MRFFRDNRERHSGINEQELLAIYFHNVVLLHQALSNDLG